MACRIGRSIGAAWALLLVELALVVAEGSGELAGIWEVQFGFFWLAPTVFAASGAVAVLAAFGWALTEHSEARWVRGLLATATGLLAGSVGWGIGGGRHLSAFVVRLGFAAGLAMAAAYFTYLLTPILARALGTRPRRVAILGASAIVVLEIVNRFVLVRLYPALHVGLGLCTLLLVPSLLVAWPARSRASAPASTRAPPLSSWLFPSLLVVAAVLALPAAKRLAYFDHFRLLLLEKAPLLGQGVRLAAELAPPAPAAAEASCDDSNPSCDGPNGAAVPRTLDLIERDLLFITIDALRADHVGAYGYKRKTTPNIDALARQGALFEAAYAATPHTSYSVTSMMTGKYMRPLLLQGAGQDSDTWASLLRTYAYRTAAFYPPAVFFIDPARFEPFSRSFLGFEYRKVEFLEGQGRVDQVRDYLAGETSRRRVFVWVHLFGPHEPYEAHPGHDFGTRDIDRYDSEVAAADETVGKLVKVFRELRRSSVVIISADHGEEFGEHGGRYHGTTVYEEQVRVPLVISAPGAVRPMRLKEPVQTIDLLATVLGALDIPRPPRLRGRDLGSLLAGKRGAEKGIALAETEEQSLLAEGTLRLICARKVGACKLYDLASDPAQLRDTASGLSSRFSELRERQRELSASHGRYELRGLRAEGKGWPAPILRGVAGDGDAAPEIAALLDDADLVIRRKAAELLFDLARPESAAALRLALGRDEDQEVRRFCALALTRLGQGAPLAFELVKSEDVRWRRLAALALGQAGDKRGEQTLVEWWRDGASRDYVRSRELLEAFAAIRSKDSVYALSQSLADVRLRPYIARTLAAIGDEAARVPLARALKDERYQSARVALARSLVELGAEGEILEPLVRFLGVPDPLPDGLHFAMKSKLLEHVGGPPKRQLERLKKQSSLGVAVTVVVPRGGNGQGIRALVRAKNFGSAPSLVRLGAREDQLKYDRNGQLVRSRNIPRIDTKKLLELRVPVGNDWVEVHGLLPPSIGARPGRSVELVVFAERTVELEAIALLPLTDELAPPAPEPWQGSAKAGPKEQAKD